MKIHYQPENKWEGPTWKPTIRKLIDIDQLIPTLSEIKSLDELSELITLLNFETNKLKKKRKNNEIE